MAIHNSSEKLQIDKKVFYRSVIALVVPMALQNLINTGVTSADVLMLGRVGETSLSAASLAGQIQFVMMLIMFGLASGASVLTAQYWGKGDTGTIERVMMIALRLAVLVALVFFAAAMAIPATLMRIYTPDEAVIAEGVKYLRFVAPSYLIMSFTLVYLNIMRSVEKVMISTIVYFISFVANVILNAILIFGLLGFPALGITGAAIATTSARIIEFVIVLVYALRNKLVRLRLDLLFSHDKLLFKDFIRYALPTILGEMMWGLAMSANAVIIGHMGSAAVAANSVAQVVRQLATVVSFGLANATAIIVGKALGAGEPKRAEAYAGLMLRMAMVAGGAAGLIIFILRPIVPGLLNLTPEAETYLKFLLLVMSFYAVAQTYTATCIIGVFRGGGDTRFGLFADTLSMWFMTIPFGAIAAFVFHWPVETVFLIIMADEFIKIPLCIWRYGTRRWLRNVTR